MEEISKEAREQIQDFFRNLFVEGLTQKIEETPEKVKQYLCPDVTKTVQSTVYSLVVPEVKKVGEDVSGLGSDVSQLQKRLMSSIEAIQSLREKAQSDHEEVVAKLGEFTATDDQVINKLDTLDAGNDILQGNVTQLTANLEQLLGAVSKLFSDNKQVIDELGQQRAEVASHFQGVQAKLDNLAAANSALLGEQRAEVVSHFQGVKAKLDNLAAGNSALLGAQMEMKEGAVDFFETKAPNHHEELLHKILEMGETLGGIGSASQINYHDLAGNVNRVSETMESLKAVVGNNYEEVLNKLTQLEGAESVGLDATRKLFQKETDAVKIALEAALSDLQSRAGSMDDSLKSVCSEIANFRAVLEVAEKRITERLVYAGVAFIVSLIVVCLVLR